jgi:hypothetical protein
MKKYFWAIIALISLIFAGVAINDFVSSLKNEGALPDSSLIFGVIWDKVSDLLWIAGVLGILYLLKKKMNPQTKFLSDLKMPISEFGKKKIPWWLLIYAFIIIGLIAYYDLFGGGF